VVYVIYANDVNGALPKGIDMLRTYGKERPSRNGPMLEMPGPVSTVYKYPHHRVLFAPARDANPFFHLFESLWMLAGRNDVAFPAQFAKNMLNYSDDGDMLNGAYGYRWRSYFNERDNLERVIHDLRADNNTRRAYLPMWDGVLDGWPIQVNGEHIISKDYPCNVGVNFKVRDEQLHMTVFCRSNDIVWGAYGANAVHFSMLQEYVASHVGVGLGTYTQVSDSFHAYHEREDWTRLVNLEQYANAYFRHSYQALPLVLANERSEQFDADLVDFFRCWEFDEDPHPEKFRTQFFAVVVAPMYKAHKHRDFRYLEPHVVDWRAAGYQWLQRRAGKVA
jgi:thymidylate synthase